MAKAGVMTTLTTFSSTTQQRAKEAVEKDKKFVKTNVHTKTLTTKQAERVLSALKYFFDKEHIPNLVATNGELSVFRMSKDGKSAKDDYDTCRELMAKIGEFCKLDKLSIRYDKGENDLFEVSLAWFDKTEMEVLHRPERF